MYGSWTRWAAALVLLVAPGVLPAQDVVRLTTGEYPPHHSEHLAHNGVLSRIVEEAFAEEGLRVEWGFFPWRRAYLLAATGQWHGTATWGRLPEREAEFLLSEPVFDIQLAFFHLKDRPFQWQSMADLAGVRIGATLEYTYGERFESAAELGEITVDWARDDETNLRKLLAGRIDVFPVDIETGYFLMARHFSPQDMERVTYNRRMLSISPSYLLLSRAHRDSERLISVFNRGLARLHASGRVDRYLIESRRGDYIRD